MATLNIYLPKTLRTKIAVIADTCVHDLAFRLETLESSAKASIAHQRRSKGENLNRQAVLDNAGVVCSIETKKCRKCST